MVLTFNYYCRMICKLMCGTTHAVNFCMLCSLDFTTLYCNMSEANPQEVIKTQRLFSSRSYDSSNEENDSVDSIRSGERGQ